MSSTPQPSSSASPPTSERAGATKRVVAVLAVLGLLLSVAAVAAFLWSRHSPGCIKAGGATVCATSDLLKLPGHGRVPDEGPDYELATGVDLRAARGETVAFQLVFLNRGDEVPATVRIEGLKGLHSERFLAVYHWVDPGGYTWGTPSQVLSWPDYYPDALVPFVRTCPEPSTLVETFPVPGPHGYNRAVWIDVYVPPETKPGTISGELVFEVGGTTTRAALRVHVADVVLPARPSFEAVAELYETYEQEGVGPLGSPGWAEMAHCYQQLAHRHRLIFLDRFNGWVGTDPLNPEPDPEAWAGYDAAFGPVLTGELFTPERGYHGPGQGVPPTVWRTPWPQPWSGVAEPLRDDDLAMYTQRAAQWSDHARARGWTQTEWFAYLFDEVDGEVDTNAGATDANLWHDEMKRMQAALDAGAGDGNVDLIWTSHAKASQWMGTNDDLVGTIRHWAPNAAAAEPEFFAERDAAGERIWFYHDGHPYIGLHAINAPGWEMATWGLLAERYGFDGMFLWAANLGDPENPYTKPSYKSDDDRFGNGTAVYPGAMLPVIPDLNLPASPGPIPSIRLKNWRRGLQDAELVRLGGDSAQARLRDHIPSGLGAADGRDPTWPDEAASWHRLRRDLLNFAAEN